MLRFVLDQPLKAVLKVALLSYRSQSWSCSLFLAFPAASHNLPSNLSRSYQLAQGLRQCLFEEGHRFFLLLLPPLLLFRWHETRFCCLEVVRQLVLLCHFFPLCIEISHYLVKRYLPAELGAREGEGILVFL